VAESAHSWGNLGYVATGTAGGFDGDAPIDAIMDLIYAPKTRYRAGSSFMMNRRTLSEVRKFKDADGNYIWQPSTLLGYQLNEVEDMPDIASEGAVMAFGDFRRVYTTKRVGGGVQDFNAIKLLKTSAG